MLSVGNNYNSYVNRTTSFRSNNEYGSSAVPKGRRYGVAAASFLLPGLGQVINNETPRGLAFFIGTICCGIINHTRPVLRSIVRVGIGIWAAIDAYKRAQ